MMIMFHHSVRRNNNFTDFRTKLFKFISTISDRNQFTVEYLKKSCGLSPDCALKASKQIVLKPPTTTPDSVLSLFKSYGFTEPQISKVITANPRLLFANPDKSLKPKLEIFSNIGISGSKLGKIFTKDSMLLKASLQKKIIPSINFVRSLVNTDSNIAMVLSRTRWSIYEAESIIGPNIAILIDHGVPKSNISKFLTTKPRNLFTESARFKEMVLQLKKLGVSPLSMMFLIGLHVLLSMKKTLWDQKLAAYRSFGWSEDEVISMFKKQPVIMACSLKKINSTLDFFMNGLKCTTSDIAKYPTVVLLSMERRVIPRCHMLQILLSMNLISKKAVGQALPVSENVFLKKYVIKFHHVVPDILKIYQSKMGTQGRGLV